MPDALSIFQQDLRNWNECKLSKTSNLVLGEGSPTADIFFIGEAPGKKEDELQRPFVGAAGKFLDSLIESIGLQRSDVYITNIVKYRPPENRDPTKEEKKICMPWLEREIEIINPKVLVPLGRHALSYFFNDVTITDAHGHEYKRQGGKWIFPIYHPAAALHNGGLRKTLQTDFTNLKKFLNSI